MLKVLFAIRALWTYEVLVGELLSKYSFYGVQSVASGHVDVVELPAVSRRQRRTVSDVDVQLAHPPSVQTPVRRSARRRSAGTSTIRSAARPPFSSSTFSWHIHHPFKRPSAVPSTTLALIDPQSGQCLAQCWRHSASVWT